MKLTTSLLLVFVLLVTATGLFSCGDEVEPKATTPPVGTSEPATTPPDENKGETPSGSLNWGDMPVYPGADEIQKGSWSIPPAEGDYSKVEWRYYETSDDADKVGEYYKDKMEDNDWEEMLWMDVADMKWGMFTKNNERDAAMIWVAAEEDNNVIAMMRATQ